MHAFVGFLAVATIAAVMPGPDSFVVLRTALADGALVARVDVDRVADVVAVPVREREHVDLEPAAERPVLATITRSP